MSYAAREASVYQGQPVELYRFTCGSQLFYYTGADSDQTYGGQTYTAIRITRGAIDNGAEDQRGELEIRAPRSLPVALLFIPDLPARPVLVDVYRFHRGDSETVVLWSGQVASAKFAGSEVTLTALPDARSFRRLIPSLTFQSQCNWMLFSPQCGLNKATYKVTATLDTVSIVTLRAAIFATFANGYFRSGWAETADGETHWITDHVGDTITLLTPFRTLVAGQSVDVYPGCDRTIAACKVFGNLAHHCGFPFVPSKNPFIQGLG